MTLLASAFSEDVTIGALSAVAVVAVIWIIAFYWRRVRVAAYNARLKQLMIERGMSADEIERVLRAGGQPAEGGRSRKHVAVGIEHVLGSGCCADRAEAKRAES